MEDFNTDLLKALVQGENINEIFRKSLEEAMNKLLNIERTAFLGYEAYDPKGHNSGNSRNGYFSRTLNTPYGELNLQIPRDRMGQFHQHTIESFSENNFTLEDTIKLLYKKGLTTRDISEIIEKMYGQYYCPQTVSNISESITEEIEAFRSKKVRKRYAVIYCDATFINIRRADTVAKEAVHIIIGISEEGYKEILSYGIYPVESAENYKELLLDLKSRGLKYVLLFVSDELTGLADTLRETFPYSLHQSCRTHILRNVATKVRSKDKREILEDLKEVHQQKSLEKSEEKLNCFYEKWGKEYPKVKKILENKDNLFTYQNFPEQIKQSIYTNNISENFNKQLKRKTKVKEQFPSEKSLDKCIYTYVSQYNNKYSSRIHKGFGLAQYELTKMLDEIEEKCERLRFSQKSSPIGEDSKALVAI